MSNRDLGWSVPVMRAGYAGRGIVYLVVAGFSLYAIWLGGEAKGTSGALAQLETTTWGGVVLLAICVGMVAYALWRILDSIYDLEHEGSDAKGMLARVGMVVTGLLHLAVGLLAFLLLFTARGDSGGQGGGSTIADVMGRIMEWPFGYILVAAIGAVTIGAGVYYIVKAVRQTYREKLYANDFTRRFNPFLRFGVAAQGVVVTIIGGLILWAGLTTNARKAGGMGESFGWLSEQVYGQLLVTGICIGLLGFAVFLFVNAAYRIVPAVAGDEASSLA